MAMDCFEEAGKREDEALRNEMRFVFIATLASVFASACFSAVILVLDHVDFLPMTGLSIRHVPMDFSGWLWVFAWYALFGLPFAVWKLVLKKAYWVSLFAYLLVPLGFVLLISLPVMPVESRMMELITFIVVSFLHWFLIGTISALLMHRKVQS